MFGGLKHSFFYCHTHTHTAPALRTALWTHRVQRTSAGRLCTNSSMALGAEVLEGARVDGVCAGGHQSFPEAASWGGVPRAHFWPKPGQAESPALQASIKRLALRTALTLRYVAKSKQTTRVAIKTVATWVRARAGSPNGVQ